MEADIIKVMESLAKTQGTLSEMQGSLANANRLIVQNITALWDSLLVIQSQVLSMAKDLGYELEPQEVKRRPCPYCGGHHLVSALESGWHCPLEPDPK